MERTKILLQTTIPFTEEDWHIERFSLLRGHLESLSTPGGKRLYEVAARNRETDAVGDDVVLSSLDETDFDELWLFAVDTGDGLTAADCEGITRFRQRGGGILAARDHQDLGSSLCTLGGIGEAHFFHSVHPEPDESRRTRDDKVTAYIDYPNYHSGANGDFQTIRPAGDVHELLLGPRGKVLNYFPSHPHEGAVGIEAPCDHARVIATGVSGVTGRPFNLLVAFEQCDDRHGNPLGRAVAESSFHHLADYNWDPDMGCPEFVTEAPGIGFKENPHALEDIKTYAANAAKWLRPAAWIA